MGEGKKRGHEWKAWYAEMGESRWDRWLDQHPWLPILFTCVSAVALCVALLWWVTSRG